MPQAINFQDFVGVNEIAAHGFLQPMEEVHFNICRSGGEERLGWPRNARWAALASSSELVVGVGRVKVGGGEISIQAKILVTVDFNHLILFIEYLDLDRDH